MKNLVSFEKNPDAVHIEHRKNGMSDLWLRRNGELVRSEEGDSWQAEEAYMQIATSECPAEDEITADFEAWFDYAASWREEPLRSQAQLQADVDYIAAVCGIDLEG